MAYFSRTALFALALTAGLVPLDLSAQQSQGGTVYAGSITGGTPDPEAGAKDDWYIDFSTGAVWVKAYNVWTKLNITLPIGAASGSAFAPVNSPTFTGTVVLPAGTAQTNLGFAPAPINSPTFTGTVTLPAGTAATNIGALGSGHVLGNSTGSSATASDTNLLSIMQQSGSGVGTGVGSAAALALNGSGALVGTISPTFSGEVGFQALSTTSEPSLTYNWAGIPTMIGDLRLQPGSLAASPEIQNVNVIQSTGGSSNSLLYFKMNSGNICVNNPGGASCWNINNVLQMQPGAGSVGATGVEQDLINLNKDYVSPSDNPLAVAFYATGASTSAYYADCAFCATGSGPTWNYGIFGSDFSHGSAAVTLSIASPGVVTETAHGYVSGQAVVFKTTGALPTGLVAGTRYYVIAAGLTANTFEVATAPGGTAVNFTGSQSGTQMAAGANVFNTAFIGDVSNSPTSIIINGSHTVGINLAGTFTQYAIAFPNGYVDGSGNFHTNVNTTTATFNSTSSASATSYLTAPNLFAGGVGITGGEYLSGPVNAAGGFQVSGNVGISKTCAGATNTIQFVLGIAVGGSC